MTLCCLSSFFATLTLFLISSSAILSVSTVAICAIESFSVTEVLYETTSALSNVGMTMGITSSLSVVSKLILSALMYFGRVGLMSLVIALAAKKENVPITRPAENMLL